MTPPDADAALAAPADAAGTRPVAACAVPEVGGGGGTYSHVGPKTCPRRTAGSPRRRAAIRAGQVARGIGVARNSPRRTGPTCGRLARATCGTHEGAETTCCGIGCTQKRPRRVNDTLTRLRGICGSATDGAGAAPISGNVKNSPRLGDARRRVDGRRKLGDNGPGPGRTGAGMTVRNSPRLTSWTGVRRAFWNGGTQTTTAVTDAGGTA